MSYIVTRSTSGKKRKSKERKKEVGWTGGKEFTIVDQRDVGLLLGEGLREAPVEGVGEIGRTRHVDGRFRGHPGFLSWFSRGEEGNSSSTYAPAAQDTIKKNELSLTSDFAFVGIACPPHLRSAVNFGNGPQVRQCPALHSCLHWSHCTDWHTSCTSSRMMSGGSSRAAIDAALARADAVGGRARPNSNSARSAHGSDLPTHRSSRRSAASLGMRVRRRTGQRSMGVKARGRLLLALTVLGPSTTLNPPSRAIQSVDLTINDPTPPFPPARVRSQIPPFLSHVLLLDVLASLTRGHLSRDGGAA